MNPRRHPVDRQKLARKRNQKKKELNVVEPNMLAQENAIRKKYWSNWPKMILELLKRVQGVNQRWSGVMMFLMSRSVRLIYQFEGDKFKVILAPPDGEPEVIEIAAEDVIQNMGHIEVALVDIVLKSKTYAAAQN